MASGGGMFLHVRTDRAGGAGRDERGQFRNQSQVREINRQLALGAQADVVNFIEERIKRKGVSTGRLASVTADPRNIYSDNIGFGVGIEDFLDKSEAKYWRQIEQGTDVHVGQEIKGVWGESRAGFYENRWGAALRGGPQYTAHGEDNGGKFVPLRRGRVFSNGLMISGKATTIKNPIEAMYAYADTFEEGGWFSTKPVEAALEYLAEVARRAFSFGG